MNIFILDINPIKAAEYHCDKHIVKMVLETAQLLCSAHHAAGPFLKPQDIPYKQTHVNHPCTKWVQESTSNYLWTYKLGLALCAQYTHRYGKVHKSQAVIEWASKVPLHIPVGDRTPFALAMPDEYKSDDAVESYRAYYHSKNNIINYKFTCKPDWLVL